MFFSTLGLILDKTKVKELDYSISLLTPKGKLRVIAKGAQKSLKRFLNLLEDLTLLRVYLRKPYRGTFPILEKADLLYLPESPREDLIKFYFFNYLAEILDYSGDNLSSKEVFNWLTDFIREIDQRRNFQWGDKFFFEAKYLSFSGLFPYLNGCLHCQKVPQKIFYFSIAQGGLLCIHCKDELVFPLKKEEIDLLRNLSKISKIKEVESLLNSLLEEERRRIFWLMERFFIYHLNYEPKSLKFLKEMGL